MPHDRALGRVDELRKNRGKEDDCFWVRQTDNNRFAQQVTGFWRVDRGRDVKPVTTMPDGIDPQIDEERGATQPNRVHENVVFLNENAETNRDGERLHKHSDSVSDNGENCAALSEHEGAGYGEHHRRSWYRDDDERKRDEGDQSIDGNHIPSLGGAYSGDMDLNGYRILVVGGTGVLGNLIAQRLRGAGAWTVVSGRQGDALTQALTHSEGFAVDLSVTGAGSALVDAVSAVGPIDGVVLAHGVVAFGNVADTSAQTTAALTAINLTSVIEIVSAAIPALRESKAAGREPFVATISGVISESAMAGAALYGASKSAVRHFVSAAQRELRREGIRVFDTRPPHTETGLAGRAISGTAPNFPQGADPNVVADRIITAIVSGETDVPSTEF